MKKYLALIGIISITAALTDCTPVARRQAANTVLDVTQIACVVANAFLDVPAVKVACKLEGIVDADLRALIESARARAKAGVPACAASGVCQPVLVDAGAD